jgi:hypothetical protein
MTGAELKELCDEYGWTLRGKHGRFILRNEHFMVKYHSLGMGACEVSLRGVDMDYAGIDVRLGKDRILELITTLDVDYAEQLFAAKAEHGIDSAKSVMRLAKRDKKDMEKMVAGWKKRHAL